MSDDTLTPSWRRVLTEALALYLVWTAATYLLEGRLLTLLRPEATLARVTYAVVANLLIGVGGATWVLRRFVQMGVLTPKAVGFRRAGRTAASIGAGLVLGLVLYGMQPSAIWDPIVMLNAFAQEFVITTAEVLVCWVAVGGACYAALRPYGPRVAITGAAIAASGLFGLYHLAHSPPFNTLDMVVLLSGVGLGTSVFYFAAREVYGTVVFHNLMGLYSVTASLNDFDELAAFQHVQWGPLAMAAVALLALAAADSFGIARDAERPALR